MAMAAIKTVKSKVQRQREDEKRLAKAKRGALPGPELDGVLAASLKTPKTEKDVANSPQEKHWRAAEEVEFFGNMITKGVLERVQGGLPDGKKAFPGKFVYKIKENADGTIWKFKARFVGLGYRQRPGVDYDVWGTYAPVTTMSCLKKVIARAAHTDMHLFQFDIEGAFLLPKIDKEIYVSYKGVTYKLHRTLYGLKQSAHAWNKELDAHLKSLGFKQSKGDPCLYTRKTEAGFIAVVTWVDDVIGAASSEQLYRDFRNSVASKFPLSAEGKFEYALKVRVRRKDGMIYMDQRTYIEGLATRFNAEETNPKYTPMDEGMAKMLSKEQMPDVGTDEHKQMQRTPYRELLGCLSYAQCIRPDISFAVNKLARFAQNPGKMHWKALKRILVYLYTTREKCLVFGRDKSNTALSVMVDADHGGDKSTARSTTGIVVKAFGDAVYTKSKRQGKVNNSTGAAEFDAIASAVRKIDNFRIVMQDLGFHQQTVVVETDSKVAHGMLKSGRLTTATKHLALDFYVVSEQMDDDRVDLRHVPGDDNTADIFTKALCRVTFEKHREGLGILSP